MAVTTIPRNHTRRIAGYKATHTACTVHTLEGGFAGQPCDPAQAWERLAALSRATLTLDPKTDTLTVRLHANCWYTLTRPAPQPARLTFSSQPADPADYLPPPPEPARQVTAAEAAVLRLYAGAENEAGRFHLPKEERPFDVPGGYALRYDDGSVLTVTARPPGPDPRVTAARQAAAGPGPRSDILEPASMLTSEVWALRRAIAGLLEICDPQGGVRFTVTFPRAGRQASHA